MKDKKIKCTVLGANGYIGRHLTYLLYKGGYEVFAYDLEELKNSNLPSEIEYKKIDITQRITKDDIRIDVNYFFCFAGYTGTKNGFDEYEKFINVNEIGLLNVLNVIRHSNYRPIVVFPSTRLVYKGHYEPLKEDDPKESKTIYASNKMACENYLKIYSESFNIPYIIYRICVPYGNLFDGNFSYGTIGNFLNNANHKKNIILYGDGELKRTFTHVVSVCHQILHSMTNLNALNSELNIAGETYSLNEVASAIVKQYEVDIEYVPWPKMDLSIESGDTVFDATKIKELICVDNEFQFAEWLITIKK